MSQNCMVTARGRSLDIRNRPALEEFLLRERPNQVIHLAGITTLRESFEDPRNTFETTFCGTLNLLSALKTAGFSGRMLFVSSSEVYGLIHEDELPVSETNQTKPQSPYAVAKIAAEALCYQWTKTEAFDIVVGRPFNHIGPGQSPRFAISDFGRQIVMIRLGLAPPILHVGDIDTTRDFTDVRDIVTAYKQLLDRGINGEIYNVCSGIERSIRSLIERMCELAGIAVELRTDSSRFRPSELRRSRGDSRKLSNATGWAPMYSIDQTLRDILDEWTVRLSGRLVGNADL